MTNERHAATRARHDQESSRWVEQLRAGHPRHDQAVARLHDVLLRVAFHELSRRRAQLGSIAGPELEDLGHQAADDALVNIMKRLDDFRGLSRFTTWAYKFQPQRHLQEPVRRPAQPARQPRARRAIHLRSCPGCRADHDGLLEAAREFGDLGPE